MHYQVQIIRVEWAAAGLPQMGLGTGALTFDVRSATNGPTLVATFGVQFLTSFR